MHDLKKEDGGSLTRAARKSAESRFGAVTDAKCD
jgi:hypothetical protein